MVPAVLLESSARSVVYGERETLVWPQRESLACVADVCFHKPNLDDSAVSDWDDTHSCTDNAIPASCTPGSALRVGNTRQTSFRLPENIRSGTRPVCPPLPFLAPNIGSGSIVDVRSDKTEEGSRKDSGSGASGSLFAGDPVERTRTTKDSWMNDGLLTCELGWLSPVGICWLRGYRGHFRW